MSDEDVIIYLKGIEMYICSTACDWVDDPSHDCDKCRDRKAFARAISAIKQLSGKKEYQ